MDPPAYQLENLRPTAIKPPSRLPAMSNTNPRPLLETSQSDLNSRIAAPGTMHPPSTNLGPAKHKIGGLPEPPTKRKTLAERAAEPLNPLRSHMPSFSRQPQSFAKSEGSILAQVSARPATSYAASSYRNISNASTNSSTSTGIRPPSRQNGVRGRPQSAAETKAIAEEETEMGVLGKRKGTPVLSFHSPPLKGITLRKTRGQPDLRNPLASADQRASSASRVRLASSSSASSAKSETGGSRRLQSNCLPGARDNNQQEAVTTKSVDDGQSVRNVSLTTTLKTAFEGLSLSPSKRQASQRHASASRHRPSLSHIPEDSSPSKSPSKIPKFSCTPSLRHAQSTQSFLTTSNFTSPIKQKPSLNALRTPVTSARKTKAAVDDIPIFLTKEKLTPVRAAWDTKGRLEDMESMYRQLHSQFKSAADTRVDLEESLGLYKSRVQEVTQQKQELSQQIKELSSERRNLASDLERARNDLHATTTDLRQARRDHERDIQDLERKHERELDDLYKQQEKESHRLERELEKIAAQGVKEMEEAKRAWEKQKDDETADLTTQHWEEIEELKSKHQTEVQRLESTIAQLEGKCESRATESASEVQALRDALSGLQGQLDVAKNLQTNLKSQLSAAEARTAAVEQEKTALISKTHFLEGNQEAQSLEFTSMSQRLQDAVDARNETLDRLRKEEVQRRKLNAMILELRGNIRVFARTRPLLDGEQEPAKNEYPDANDLDGGKELIVPAPTTFTVTGKEKNEKHPYTFDRVFRPQATNAEVFEDCRELIQSVVDGYNVSILSYGQTGSGKTFGMSGPNGIIPSSISMLLSELDRLREKGWEYQVEASFVEVYNETINDLLGDAKAWDDGEDLSASVRPGAGKRKDRHEIHHDEKTGKTTVANLSSVSLWPPPENEGAWPPAAPLTSDDTGSHYTEQAVTRLLETAAKNRRVAATKANERSSRSHSVFMLTLHGQCAATGESSEGVLNLVDLAGSERLKQSGAEGDRKKETAAINKSLSALGDVIGALGNGRKGDDNHVPYRNSKLTYLLQSSLGGTTAGKSSRTLMLLHLSPLQAHWQESRSSLLFGSKVRGTHIGTAKRK